MSFRFSRPFSLRLDGNVGAGRTEATPPDPLSIASNDPITIRLICIDDNAGWLY